MTKFTKIGIAGAICSAVVSVATSIAYAVLYKKTNELPNSEHEEEVNNDNFIDITTVTDEPEPDTQPDAE